MPCVIICADYLTALEAFGPYENRTEAQANLDNPAVHSTLWNHLAECSEPHHILDLIELG